MTRLEENEFEIAGFIFELDLGTIFEGFGDRPAGTVELQDSSPVGPLKGF